MCGTSGFGEYFDALSGSWLLQRAISSGETVKGIVEFKRINDAAFLVSEEGEMRLADGTNFSAKRQWQWHFDGSKFGVYFAETPIRLYHEFFPVVELEGWSGVGRHECAPDSYIGDYQFLISAILVRQVVSGPKKDYQIHSEYLRG